MSFPRALSRIFPLNPQLSPLTKEIVELVVCTDPNSDDCVAVALAYGAVLLIDANRPDTVVTAELFETKRGVVGILREQRVSAACSHAVEVVQARYKPARNSAGCDLTTMAVMRELQITAVLTEDNYFLHVGIGFQLLPKLLVKTHAIHAPAFAVLASARNISELCKSLICRHSLKNAGEVVLAVFFIGECDFDSMGVDLSGRNFAKTIVKDSGASVTSLDSSLLVGQSDLISVVPVGGVAKW